MTLAPLIPVWLIALCAAASLFAAWRSYRAPSWPAVLRLLALSALALLALNPVSDGAPAGEPPRVALVLDASGSMARDDADGPRLAAAREALAAVGRGLGNAARGETSSLADRLAPGLAKQAAGGTDFAPLAGLTAGIPPVALVLASDGADRGSDAPDPALAAAGVPVYCIGVGSPLPPANAAVRLEAATATAFAGQDVPLTAVVTATAGSVGLQAVLDVHDEAGRQLLHRELVLAADQRLEVAVPAGDSAGPRRWVAELAVPPGDATHEDNISTAAVRVVDRKLTIALIEGSPWWDTAALVRALRRDRQFDVGAVHRLGARAYRSGDAAALPTPAGIAAADVIILGLDAGDLLTAAERAAIVARIDAGAGLLLVGIHDGLAPPLGALDPVLRASGRREAVRLTATPAAARLALLPGDGDPLPAITAGLVAGLRPLSEVLLGDDSLPLAVRRRSGAGMVATLNAEGMWRWAMAGRGEAADRLWRQLVRAVAGSGGGLAADRARYRPGQTAVVATPATATVMEVTPPGATSRTVPVADGVARLLLDSPGAWRIAAGTEAIDLVVEADSAEVAASARDDARLRRLAAATGGRMVAAGDAEALGRELAARAGLVAGAPAPRPLVPGGILVMVPLVLLCAEWWLRRHRHGAL